MADKKFDCSLYLVTDTELYPRDNLLKTVEQALIGGVTLVQLREKNISSRLFFEEACALLKLTHSFNVPLIINDRADIMLASGADGLHIGQSDLPAETARRIIGQDRILGLSAGNVKEAKAAQADGADYIGVGAVFPTSTKSDARPAGVQILCDAVRSVDIPAVGIGGISEKNIAEIYGCGADGVAVVSAIMGAPDPQNAAAALKEMVKNL